MTDRSWMTALEMQFAALQLASTHFPTDTNRKGETQRRMLLLDGLRRAEAFDWASDTTAAVAMASRTIPKDSALLQSALPSSCAWWYFGINEHVPYESVLFQLIPEQWSHGRIIGISLTVFKQDPEFRAPFPLASFMWGFGETLPTLIEASQKHGHLDDDHLHAIRIVGAFILAGCAWLQQRILTWSNGHVERHRRKQLAREHNAPLPSDVKVIQLRRLESQTRPSGVTVEPVDWSCRWIVNGHWRNQPYKDERKLIYIMPFVKGPTDKPLRVPTHTVYHVNR
jgi:hypothetical protein